MVKTVCDRLVYIINYKKDEHKGKSVLAIVIKIAQDDDDNHKREIAMRLFWDFTPLVHTNLIQLYVIIKLILLQMVILIIPLMLEKKLLINFLTLVKKFQKRHLKEDF